MAHVYIPNIIELFSILKVKGRFMVSQQAHRIAYSCYTLLPSWRSLVKRRKIILNHYNNMSIATGDIYGNTYIRDKLGDLISQKYLWTLLHLQCSRGKDKFDLHTIFLRLVKILVYARRHKPRMFSYRIYKIYLLISSFTKCRATFYFKFNCKRTLHNTQCQAIDFGNCAWELVDFVMI